MSYANGKTSKIITPEERLLRAVFGRGRRPGCGQVTLKRILGNDPQTLMRCMRPSLSLDYTYETLEGDTQSLLELINPASIVGSEGKTFTDKIYEDDILRFTKLVRKEIEETWQKPHSRGRSGIEVAVKVFDGLCEGETDSEISRSLKISRERVRQVHERLKELPTVMKMRRELRAMISDKE